jgi:hypothetical protein
VNTSTSFVESLLDFSFTSFVTSKIIKLLYGLSILGAGLTAVIMIVCAFAMSALAGIFTLIIVAPLAFAIIVVYSRVLLEIIIVVFRISEHAAEIAANTRKPA